MAIDPKKIKRLFNEAIREGKAWDENDKILKTDQECYDQLHRELKKLTPLQILDDEYKLERRLKNAYEWRLRISYGELLDVKAIQYPLLHSYKLLQHIMVLNDFRYQEVVLSGVKLADTTPAVRNVIELAMCQWVMFTVDKGAEYRGAAEALAASFVRKDLAIFNDEPHYDFYVALNRFFLEEDFSDAAIQRLDSVTQLKSISAAWQNEQAFRQLTEQWCDWHFEFSLKTRSAIFNLGLEAYQILFPAWVFALDRARQRALACGSALGQHELIEIGRKFINAIQAENLPKPQVLLETEKYYAKAVGKRAPNCLAFWTDYMRVN